MGMEFPEVGPAQAYAVFEFTTDADLDHAIGLMVKHRALEDTIGRARHYAQMSRDALELFPASSWKQALLDAVEFAVQRAH